MSQRLVQEGAVLGGKADAREIVVPGAAGGLLRGAGPRVSRGPLLVAEARDEEMRQRGQITGASRFRQYVRLSSAAPAAPEQSAV